MRFVKTANFDCTPATLWDVLTNPQMTEQYMFGCQVLSDWTIGSPVIWKAKTPEGEEIVYVQGEVLEYEEGRNLQITMFDPNMGLADIPSNYVKLTYTVSASGNESVLTIIQDFTGVENAAKRHDESLAGWDMILPKMQAMVVQN